MFRLIAQFLLVLIVLCFPATLRSAPLASRVDAAGDPLPAGAIARFGTIRLRHADSEYIACAAVSPDGKLIASGDGVSQILRLGRRCEEPSHIRLWDAVTGREVRRFGGDTFCIDGLAFSPDGKRLASAEGRVRLWDVATGKQLWETEGRTARVAFSPNGKQLAVAGGDDGTISLLDAANGKTTRTWTAAPAAVECLVFSPDGKSLGATVGEAVHLWDVATGREVQRIAGKNEAEKIRSFAFAPGGKALVISWGDGTICLWDVAASKKTLELERSGKQLGHHLAISPDGKTIAAEDDGGNFVLWDATTGRRTLRLGGHRAGVGSLAFTSDGRTLVSAGGQAILLRDVATGQERLSLEAHHDIVESLSFAPDGRTLASGSRDGTIRVWEVATARGLRRLCNQEVPVWCVRHSPDGKLLASTSGDNRVRLWELGSGKEVRSFRVQRKSSEAPFSVAFAPRGNTLASVSDDAVLVWSVVTGDEVARISASGRDALTGVAFFPSGDVIATARGQNSIQQWATATGKPISRWVGGESYRVGAISITADGKTAAASGVDGATYLWDTATGDELPQFTRHRGGGLQTLFHGSASAFSPDGRLLAAGTLSSPVDLREVLTGDRVATLDVRSGGPCDEVWALAFSPDGRTLATGGRMDYSILLWDLTGLADAGRSAPTRLTAEEAVVCWGDVGNADAARAQRAIWTLAAASRTAVPLVRQHLRPVPKTDAVALTRLIADLDSDDFATREKAQQAIAAHREGAEAELRRALRGPPSAEVGRRLNELLGSLRSLAPESLQEVRGVAVLEYAGTSEAREALEALAKGAPEARRTREAKAALERLTRRGKP